MTTNGFNILINGKSGTVLGMGQEAVASAIGASGLTVAELCFSEPEDMQANLERLRHKRNALLVGGGDGTIRETAKYLAPFKRPFGILPFGTMNLLAHDLGLDTLASALSAYARGARQDTIDAGFVNGEIFLCCASIGTMPQASVYREKNRLINKFLLMPQLFLFVLRNFDRHKREHITITVDDATEKVRTPAVVVSANAFADSQKLTESNFKRTTLDGGELAVYIFTSTSHATHLRFLWRLIFGHWLNDPALITKQGRKVRITNHHRRDLVSIDGEVTKLKTPLDFSIEPGLIRMLVPLPEEPEAETSPKTPAETPA